MCDLEPFSEIQSQIIIDLQYCNNLQLAGFHQQNVGGFHLLSRSRYI